MQRASRATRRCNRSSKLPASRTSSRVFAFVSAPIDTRTLSPFPSCPSLAVLGTTTSETRAPPLSLPSSRRRRSPPWGKPLQPQSRLRLQQPAKLLMHKWCISHRSAPRPPRLPSALPPRGASSNAPAPGAHTYSCGSRGGARGAEDVYTLVSGLPLPHVSRGRGTESGTESLTSRPEVLVPTVVPRPQHVEIV